MKSKITKGAKLSAPSDKALTSFAKKLEKWGSTLPANEQPFAQFLSNRVRDLKPDAIVRQKLQVALGGAVRTLFRSKELIYARQGLEGWVEIGPIWLRNNPTGWVEIGPIWLRNN
jgi:hypothetical protein